MILNEMVIVFVLFRGCVRIQTSSSSCTESCTELVCLLLQQLGQVSSSQTRVCNSGVEDEEKYGEKLT